MTGRCACDAGYTGVRCEERECSQRAAGARVWVWGLWGGIGWALQEVFGHRRAVPVALRGSVLVGGGVPWVHGCEEQGGAP